MAELRTGGFARASVMPDAAVTDPRLLALDLSSILRGAGQGLQLAGAYGQTRDAALARQEAAALAEPRLAALRSQYELAPQLGRNQLALAEDTLFRRQATPVELLEGSSISRNPEGDTIQLDTFTQIDPRTKQSSLVTRAGKPLQLAEDKSYKAAAADARDAANRIREDQIAAATKAAEVAEARRVADAADRRARDERDAKLDKELADLKKTAANDPFKKLSQLEKVRISDGRTLAEYMQDTRDETDNIRKDVARDKSGKMVYRDAPGWGTGDEPAYTGKLVPTNPQAEALVKQYRALSAQALQEPDLSAPAALQSVPVAAPPPVPTQQAINFLRANPATAALFEQTYGVNPATYLQP